MFHLTQWYKLFSLQHFFVQHKQFDQIKRVCSLRFRKAGQVVRDQAEDDKSLTYQEIETDIYATGAFKPSKDYSLKFKVKLRDEGEWWTREYDIWCPQLMYNTIYERFCHWNLVENGIVTAINSMK